VWLSAIVLAAVGAAYANSLDGEFIFDDIVTIRDNPTITRLDDLATVLSPPAQSTTGGRPLVNLTLAVNYAIGGLNVRSYHVFNLAVHLAAVLTLLGLVRQSLLSAAVPAAVRGGADWLAAAVALLWGLHPLGTMAVSYTVQRAESLMALWYLLVLYFSARMIRADADAGLAGGVQRTAWAWGAAAILCCLAGATTKEVIVSAPLAVLLWDRALGGGSWRQAIRRRWPLYLGLAASWVVLAVLAIPLKGRMNTAGFGFGYSPLEYLFTQMGVILHYLGLAFAPITLCVDYKWPIATSVWQVLPGAIVVGALAALTIWALVKRPAWGLVGACFFMVLAPTSSVLPVVDPAFEHRMYLPLAAVVTAVVLGFWRLVAGRLRWAPLVAAAALLACAGALGARTHFRNADYRTAIGLWSQTIEAVPTNPRARFCLGERYLAAGRHEEALSLLNDSIALYVAIERPTGADVHALPSSYDNRGLALVGLKRYAEAIEAYGAAIAIDSSQPQYYYNRGVAWMRLGQRSNAIADFTTAIKLRPSYAHAYYRRGVCLYELGQIEPAKADVARYIEHGGARSREYEAFVSLLMRNSPSGP
jgi:Flp pilus assembly protein TadD